MSDNILNNESALLEQVSLGNEEAFKQLFEYYWPIIYANILQFTKDSELAKDLGQDVFYKVWTNRTKLPDIRSFRSFLYTIAKNLIIDSFRKKIFTTEGLTPLRDFFINASELPDRILEIKELDQHIQAAISSLPEQVQKAFLLKRREGLSHDDIAKRMGISAISSRNYITRAVNAVRAYLEKNLELVILSLALALS